MGIHETHGGSVRRHAEAPATLRRELAPVARIEWIRSPTPSNHAGVPTKITYTLSGCPNDVLVEIRGTGTLSRGRLRVAVRPAVVRLTWDPAFALLGGLDPLLALAAGLVGDLNEPLVARSRVDVLGEGLREVGTIVTVSETARERGRLTCSIELVEARLAFEVGERLVVDAKHEIVVVARGGGLSYEVSFSSTRGGDYLATVTTRFSAPLAGAVGDHSIRCRIQRRPPWTTLRTSTA